MSTSLWEHTAPPALQLPALRGHRQADVVIIGGGYTGLSTAYHAARHGLAPVVLEARQVAWGASGRNGGFVSPRVRKTLPSIAAGHGMDVAKQMYRTGLTAVDHLEEMAAMLGECGFSRNGMLLGAHDDASLGRIRAGAAWMNTHFGEGTINVLDRAEIADKTGSPMFIGGSLAPLNAQIHPLAYARSLARAMTEQGIDIFEESPALRISRDAQGVTVQTPEGTVQASQIVFATNAYSQNKALPSTLYRSLIPFQSAAIATSPMPPDIRSKVLKFGHNLSDARRVMRWVRLSGDRLVFGGRGAFDVTATAAVYARLSAEMHAMFPSVAQLAVEFEWSGFVAMTLDELPHIGKFDDRTLYACAYNGTGVAMSNLMGKYLAQWLTGKAPDVGLLSAPLRAVPFHALRKPAVQAATGWMMLLDRLGR